MGMPRRLYRVVVILPVVLSGMILNGCVPTGGRAWKTGQVELASVDPHTRLLFFKPIACEQRSGVLPKDGDPVRFNSDPVLMTVESVNLAHLPRTVTGSQDVLVFADVWENASAGYDSQAVTRVVAHAPNVQLPSRLNFSGAPIYGSVAFKGKPLRVRLTVLVLQKERAQQLASLVDVGKELLGFAGKMAPVLSEAANMVKAGLLAQPDVVALQFDAYFRSDEPEEAVEIAVPKYFSAVTERIPEDAPYYWLCYRKYALVETIPFGASVRVPGTENRGSVLDGQRIQPVSSPGGDLVTNYVVFGVDYRQPPEDGAVLEEAAKADRTLMAGLTKSSSDVQAALKELSDSADRMTQAILKAEADRRARRAAKNETNQKAFAESFDSLWGEVTGRFAEGSRERALADFVGKAIRNRWEDRFSAVPGSAAPTP